MIYIKQNSPMKLTKKQENRYYRTQIVIWNTFAAPFAY